MFNAPELTAAVKFTYVAYSPGRGPTTSIPFTGTISLNSVITNSALPEATYAVDAPELGAKIIFGFT